MRVLPPGSRAERLVAARQGFRSAYGGDAEVVARAPGRVNLIGEHVDYNRGLCLPIAIPHAAYAAAAAREDGSYRITSSQAGETWCGGIEDAAPGRATGWAAYAAGTVWAMRQAGITVPGLDLWIDSTVPLGAGLSSSAALECSVAVAGLRLAGQRLTDAARELLVAAGMRAETDVAGTPTGGLDQTTAMFARADHALLLDFDDGSRSLVPVTPAADGLALLVVDTRVSHALVDGEYAARRADCDEAAVLLRVPSLRRAAIDGLDALPSERLRRRVRHVISENARVAAATEAVRARQWTELGRLLTASHESLRDDFEVSCPELDLVVSTALDAGALGARMTGGGFGGSAFALVREAELRTTAEAIARAFAGAGFGAPDILVVTPSAGAG